MRSRRIAIAAFFWAFSAHAEPSPADRALATDLFDRGRTLLAEGKYAEACPKFDESQRLDPSPGTLLNLANCHELEGKTATAWTEFNQALAVAEREGQTDRVTFAESHIRALAPRLSRLVIVLPPELADVDVEITRDGSPIPRVAIGSAIPIDPGSHRVEAKARGYATWSSPIEIGDAERRDIVVGPLVRSEEPPPPPPPPPPPTPEPPPVRRPVLAMTLGGIGIAGIAVGAVAGIVAIDKSARSDSRCSPRCNDEGYSLNQGAKTAADVATVAFAVGAASLGAGIVLYLATGSPSLRF